jgi:hypothetical protein
MLHEEHATSYTKSDERISLFIEDEAQKEIVPFH